MRTPPLFFAISLLSMACQPRLPEIIPFIEEQETHDLYIQNTELPCRLRLPTEHLCAELQWIYIPPQKSATGEFLLSFYEDTKLKDPVQEPFVKLWMRMKNGMEHGSSPIKLEPEGPGRYRARGVYFSMPGSWRILVQLRDRKNKHIILDQARQNVQIKE